MRRPFIFTSLGVVRGESKRGNRKCGPENLIQTMYTLNRCHILQHLIWIFTVCQGFSMGFQSEGIWATAWQNQQNGICTQRRLRSAGASAQSDQSSLSAWRNLWSLATHWTHSEGSDQTGLIWVLSGHTSFYWFCHVQSFKIRIFHLFVSSDTIPTPTPPANLKTKSIRPSYCNRNWRLPPWGQWKTRKDGKALL